MRGKSSIFKFTVLTAVVVLALSLVGVVAAQDTGSSSSDTSTTPPALGIAVNADDHGAAVVQVYPGSPAETAGIQVGDVITAVDGQAITADQIGSLIRSHAVGDTITLTVLRGTTTQDIDVTLAAYQFPESTATPNAPTTGQTAPAAQQPYLGVQVQDSANGISVVSVESNSPAETAGVQAGDIITSINGTNVANYSELRAAIVALNVGDSVSIGVTRNGESMTLQATLGSTTAAPQSANPPVPVQPRNNGNNGRNPGGIMGNAFGFTFNNGKLTVTNLPQNSPLYQAGLRDGDQITAINGQPVDMSTLFNLHLTSGQDVTLTVDRNGTSMDITIPADSLNLMPGTSIFPNGQTPFGNLQGNTAYLGVRFVTLDAQAAQQYNTSVQDGAYIAEVVANSPAASAGLQQGDVITAVDGDKVDAEHTLSDRLYAYEPGDTVTLDVLRGSDTMQIQATLGSAVQSAGVFPFGNMDNFPGMRGYQFRMGPNGMQMIGPDGQPFSVPTPEPTPGPQF